MKTSPSQFKVMVDFMKRNGDLNKPSDGPRGRLRAIAMWQELTGALNLDTTGTAKPVEKWKKVWSDLKNNTKRKASKIHQAAGGTGGGPACILTLTDQEQRVLNIIGPQAATGLISVEEDCLEVSSPKPPVESTGGLAEVSPKPSIQEVVQVESIIADSNRPGESGQSITQPLEEEMVEATVTSPTRHHTLSPQTRDEHWRNLAIQFVTENLRLREIELQQQSQWQTLFAKLIDLMKLFENKINK